jgi:hypothetical protein
VGCSIQQNKTGLNLSLVQANRVGQYAGAAGILAKTDKVDARVLCAFGSAMQPEPTLPLSVQQKQLREARNAAPTLQPYARCRAKSAGTVKR